MSNRLCVAVVQWCLRRCARLPHASRFGGVSAAQRKGRAVASPASPGSSRRTPDGRACDTCRHWWRTAERCMSETGPLQGQLVAAPGWCTAWTRAGDHVVAGGADGPV